MEGEERSCISRALRQAPFPDGEGFPKETSSTDTDVHTFVGAFLLVKIGLSCLSAMLYVRF